VHVFAIRRTSATMDDIVRRTGPDWVVARERKVAFTYDDARLKVSTVASFKGWSSSRVVFVLPAGRPRPDGAILRQVYVGLTRSEGEAIFIGRPGESFGVDGLGLPRLPVKVQGEATARYAELEAEAVVATALQAPHSIESSLTEPPWPAEEGR